MKLAWAAICENPGKSCVSNYQYKFSTSMHMFCLQEVKLKIPCEATWFTNLAFWFYFQDLADCRVFKSEWVV